jgi:hypothetical protein
MRGMLGSDATIAAGIEARSVAPLCRALVEAAHNPETKLEFFRGDMLLALRVRAIGKAARGDVLHDAAASFCCASLQTRPMPACGGSSFLRGR